MKKWGSARDLHEIRTPSWPHSRFERNTTSSESWNSLEWYETQGDIASRRKLDSSTGDLRNSYVTLRESIQPKVIFLFPLNSKNCKTINIVYLLTKCADESPLLALFPNLPIPTHRSENVLSEMTSLQSTDDMLTLVPLNISPHTTVPCWVWYSLALRQLVAAVRTRWNAKWKRWSPLIQICCIANRLECLPSKMSTE